MSNEITFIMEPDRGRVTVEISGVSRQRVDGLNLEIAGGTNLNCGKPSPQRARTLPIAPANCETTSQIREDRVSLWVYQLYHGSVVDGPGRRTVIQTAGCSIKCPGCYVPETHERTNGSPISIFSIAKEVVANSDEHDGVTILGGEPFDQPAAVAELVARLRNHDLHILIYSGYTLEALIEMKNPNVDYILTHLDMLIDGPFDRKLRKGAGEYRGSRNQRIFGT